MMTWKAEFHNGGNTPHEPKLLLGGIEHYVRYYNGLWPSEEPQNVNKYKECLWYYDFVGVWVIRERNVQSVSLGGDSEKKVEKHWHNFFFFLFFSPLH